VHWICFDLASFAAALPAGTSPSSPAKKKTRRLDQSSSFFHRPPAPCPRPSLNALFDVHHDLTRCLLSSPHRTGAPIDLIQPATLRAKVEEPLLLLGKQRFGIVDIRVRCKGGGRVAQIYGELMCCLGARDVRPVGAWACGRGSKKERAGRRALLDSTKTFSLPSLPPTHPHQQPSARPSPRAWSPSTRNVRWKSGARERSKERKRAHTECERERALRVRRRRAAARSTPTLHHIILFSFTQTSTRPPRRRSRTCWPRTIAPCWSRTPAAASPRSLAARARAPASRNPTGETWGEEERGMGVVVVWLPVTTRRVWACFPVFYPCPPL